MARIPKVDNSTLAQKTYLRQRILRELADLVVLETHAGYGAIYQRCYQGAVFGVAIEVNRARAEAAARQRPRWAVYQADAAAALAAGLAADVPFSLVDIDPYGSPWPTVQGLFGSARKLADRLVIAVNDGLRLKLKRGGGWEMPILRPFVERFGNDAVYHRYLEICQELMEREAAQAGYRLDRWEGSYCGFAKQMTHYAAWLARS